MQIQDGPIGGAFETLSATLHTMQEARRKAEALNERLRAAVERSREARQERRKRCRYCMEYNPCERGCERARGYE